MLDDLNTGGLGCRRYDVIMEFPRTAMNEYASGDDVVLFLDVREVSPELLDGFYSWGSLLAFHNDGPVFPIKQDYV